MIIENFDDFYDHYQGFSAYVAFCITEYYELSKDISQEVFLALFKVKEKLDYSRPDKLKALVMKATSNKCMDYYRKASSRQESYTIDDEENAYEPVDEKSNPEARILRMEEEKYQKLVLNRLRKRNPMNYDILVKTKFQELSAAEVASEYGILRSAKRYDGWNPSVCLQTLLLRKNDGCHTADGSYPEVSHQ